METIETGQFYVSLTKYYVSLAWPCTYCRRRGWVTVDIFCQSFNKITTKIMNVFY